MMNGIEERMEIAAARSRLLAFAKEAGMSNVDRLSVGELRQRLEQANWWPVVMGKFPEYANLSYGIRIPSVRSNLK